MNVVMIYKYGKQFRFAPSFNYSREVSIKGKKLYEELRYIEVPNKQIL